MTGTFMNIATVPVPLADGRVLAPGETAELEPGSEHNQRLEEDGQIARMHDTAGDGKAASTSRGKS